MFIDGKLYEAIQNCIDNGTKIGLMILDEEEKAAPGEISMDPYSPIRNINATTYQQMIIMYMQAMDRPIWVISHRTASPKSGEPYDATRTALKALFNGRQQPLRKRYYNAFQSTTLHLDLKEHNLTHLVVMGWKANMCVSSTVGIPGTSKLEWNDTYGFTLKYLKRITDGATYLGYTVMTCDQILHAGPADWSHANPAHFDALEFYSRFI
ncbi:MAG: isochorismatase family protein [Psychromonas sp.]|nr:isochorismatase family protein [Psychromonas sp.]